MVKTATTTTAAADASPSATVSEVKYKGVRKRKWGKYVSEIRLPNSRERIWLGSYDSAAKAARAFDAALFCLRGPGAKFNFPDDPPEIDGGRMLTPAEIQAVAQHYASSYGSMNEPAPAQDGGQLQPPPAVELEDASPSSNSEGAGPMDSIDWSFLDMLDSEIGGSNAGHVSDFGLFHEPGDMFLPPHLGDKDNDDDDDDDNSGNGGNVPYFLWNF